MAVDRRPLLYTPPADYAHRFAGATLEWQEPAEYDDEGFVLNWVDSNSSMTWIAPQEVESDGT